MEGPRQRWRSRDRIAMALFSFLVVIVLHFALPTWIPSVRRLAPGLLWRHVFWRCSARAFALELENEALSALAMAPADRGFVFLGKAAANFVLLAVVQFATAVVFGLAFAIDLVPVAVPLAGVVALGSIGLCSVGTLFSAVAVRTRYREVMLPLLILPLLVPVLLGAVSATAALLQGEGVPRDSVQLLIVTDAVFLIVSFLGFDYVLDE
jgi:heme exporter protein B